MAEKSFLILLSDIQYFVIQKETQVTQYESKTRTITTCRCQYAVHVNADDIFTNIFFNWEVWSMTKISLKYISNSSFDN